MLIRSFSIVAGLLVTCVVCAAEPAAEEKLPAPRQVPEVIGPPLPNPMYYRRSHYDVWQMYAPDMAGYWKPRVIVSPSGAYWAYNGAPYPYLVINQGAVMPTAVGTPYRAAPAFMPYCED